MASPVDPSAYKEALIFLGTAGVVIPIFRKLGLSSILGFLIVGALIGPNMLGRLSASWPWLANFVFTESEELTRLAELGVVFLLFLIGIELSFERLITMRRLVFGLLEHVGQGAQHLLHDGNGGVVQRAGHREFTSEIGHDGRSWRGRGPADHARLTAQGELNRPGFCGQLFSRW